LTKREDFKAKEKDVVNSVDYQIPVNLLNVPLKGATTDTDFTD